MRAAGITLTDVHIFKVRATGFQDENRLASILGETCSKSEASGLREKGDQFNRHAFRGMPVRFTYSSACRISDDKGLCRVKVPRLRTDDDIVERLACDVFECCKHLPRS